MFHFTLKWYQHYKRTLYKREALQELQKFTTQSKEEVVSILGLAKRVGIAAYGRDKVAMLDGERWWDFIEKNSSAKVSRKFREEIALLLYDANTQELCADYKAIKSIVEEWIKTHKVVNHV